MCSSDLAALSAQAQESQARAAKLAAEAAVVPQELEIDKINAITRNLREGDAEDKEFERRLKVAETLIKEKAIDQKGQSNANDTTRNANPARPSQQPLQGNVPAPSGSGEESGGII